MPPHKGEGDVRHRALHSDSVFKQPLPNSHVTVLSRIDARGELLVLPLATMRGMERSEAHLVSFRSRHRLRGDELRKRIASRRSIAAILGEWSVLPDGTGEP